VKQTWIYTTHRRNYL